MFEVQNKLSFKKCQMMSYLLILPTEETPAMMWFWDMTFFFQHRIVPNPWTFPHKHQNHEMRHATSPKKTQKKCLHNSCFGVLVKEKVVLFTLFSNHIYKTRMTSVVISLSNRFGSYFGYKKKRFIAADQTTELVKVQCCIELRPEESLPNLEVCSPFFFWATNVRVWFQ